MISATRIKKTIGDKIISNKQEGIGVIEIILILVIIIGLVLIFKQQITSIVNKIFSTISGDVNTIVGP